MSMLSTKSRSQVKSKSITNRVLGHFRGTTRAPHQRQRRMVVEGLERRELMTAVWDGGLGDKGGNDLWSNPINWVNHVCPASGEEVSIPAAVNGVKTPTIKIGGGNFARDPGRVTSYAPLDISWNMGFGAGSRLNAATTINAGTVTFDVGTQIKNDLTIKAGAVDLSNISTIVGHLNWSGGTIRGQAAGVGTTQTNVTHGILITGNGGKTLNTHQLNNGGEGQWTGGTVWLANGAVFNNSLNAQFTVNTIGNTSLKQFDGDATGLVKNFGKWNVVSGISGLGSVAIVTPFANWGTVDIDKSNVIFWKRVIGNGGVFDLSGGSSLTLNGDYSGTSRFVLSNATIGFAGRSTTMTSASSITGDGNVVFRNGTAIVAGTYDIERATKVQSGVVTFNTAEAYTGFLEIAGGTLVLSPGTVLHVDHNYTQTGGVLKTVFRDINENGVRVTKWGKIDCEGLASLSKTLWIDGTHVLKPFEEFRIIDAPLVTGKFGSAVITCQRDNLARPVVHYHPDAVDLYCEQIPLRPTGAQSPANNLVVADPIPADLFDYVYGSDSTTQDSPASAVDDAMLALLQG